MKEHIVRIRHADRLFFKFLKDSIKTIETRAATPKYQKIQEGDFLIFVCDKNKLKKKVKKVYFFKTIDELFKKFDFKKIMPHISSEEATKEIWYSFSNYKEKISKSGIIAFVLGD